MCLFLFLWAFVYVCVYICLLAQVPYDRVLEGFTIIAHEPYYINYTKQDLVKLFQGISISIYIYIHIHIYIRGGSRCVTCACCIDVGSESWNVMYWFEYILVTYAYHVYKYINMCMYIMYTLQIHVSMYVHTCVHTHLRAHTHTHVAHIHTHGYIQVYMYYIHICTWKYVYMCIYAT